MFESPPPPDFPRPKLKTAITTGWSWPRIIRTGNHMDPFSPRSYIPARSPPHNHAPRDTVLMKTEGHSDQVAGSDRSLSASTSICSDCDGSAGPIGSNRSLADVIQSTAKITQIIEHAVCDQKLRSPNDFSSGDVDPEISKCPKATATKSPNQELEIASNTSDVEEVPPIDPGDPAEQAAESILEAENLKDADEDEPGSILDSTGSYTMKGRKSVRGTTCTSPAQSKARTSVARSTCPKDSAHLQDEQRALVSKGHCYHRSDVLLEADNRPSREPDDRENHSRYTIAIRHDIAPVRETIVVADRLDACVHHTFTSGSRSNQGAPEADSCLLSRGNYDADQYHGRVNSHERLVGGDKEPDQRTGQTSNHPGELSSEINQDSMIEQCLQAKSKIANAEGGGESIGDQIVACEQHRSSEPLLPPQIIVHEASEASDCAESVTEIDAHRIIDSALAQENSIGNYHLQDIESHESPSTYTAPLSADDGGRGRRRSSASKATRSSLMIRKTRNIFARRPVLTIFLGRQIAGPTKKALRCRARGESICPQDYHKGEVGEQII